MICPRCSVADISDDTHQCPLCGFSPSASVIVEQPVLDEVFQAVQQALADRFDIERVLRLGERSFVYVARELPGGRSVALKVVPVAELVDHEIAGRFERQAGLAAALNHSHIVPLYAYGTTRAFLWYSMEYVRGHSLAEWLRELGPMPLDVCVRVAEQVGSAIDYAHRRGVVHGNLKPTNIFVDDRRWLRVSDFAVAEVFGQPIGPGGRSRMVTRPEYLAPEQFYARSVGASADQYALAVILYECLSRSLPFVGDSLEEVARLHATEPPPRLSEVRPDLPVHVLDAFQRALFKEPAGRFPTALDFTSALSGGLQPRSTLGRSSAPPVTSSVDQPPLLVVDGSPWRFTVRRLLLGVMVLAILGIAATAMLGPELVSQFIARAKDAATSLVGGGDAAEADPLRWETFEPVEAARPRITQAESLDAAQAPGTPTPPPASQQSQVTATPPPAVQPGRLFVNSRPWGELYVDGQRIGNTPQVGVTITPGVHLIRVVRDGFEPFERRVRVASGQEVRLTDILLEPLEQ
jgi:serine/threonine-protein kinase